MCGTTAIVLDSADSTGPGPTIDLGQPRAFHTLIVSEVTGSPSSWFVALEGSHDGVVWVHLAQVGSSDGIPPRSVSVNAAIRYVRGNLVNLDGGTSPTVSATVASL